MLRLAEIVNDELLWTACSIETYEEWPIYLWEASEFRE